MTDAVAANIKHYDHKHAHQYDTPESRAMARQVVTHILRFAHPDLAALGSFAARPHPAQLADDEDRSSSSDEDEEDEYPVWRGARVLDFACGTGLISQHLVAHVAQTVGVDVSPDMVAVYNRKALDHGIPAEAMCACAVDLCDDEAVDAVAPTVPGGLAGFDAAVCSLAYHHIDDIDRASGALLRRLRPGGWVFVVDLALGTAEDGGSQRPAPAPPTDAHHHAVPHRGGFAPTELADSLSAAGFVNVTSHAVFAVKLWATDAYISKFKGHHAHTNGGDASTRHGMKVWDQKTLPDGSVRYLVKTKMVMAVGQRPLL